MKIAQTRIAIVLLGVMAAALVCGGCNSSESTAGVDAIDAVNTEIGPVDVTGVDGTISLADAVLDRAMLPDEGTSGEVALADTVDAGPVVPPGCCVDDSDCDTGMVCVKTNHPDFGECAAVPVEPYCYFADDCPVLHGCYDAVYCDCVDDCEPLPGTCGPSNGECCEDDSDCPEGGFCMISKDDPGNTACLALPDPGKCWDDSFCDEGEICEGAKWSGCAFLFVGPLTFGSCTPCVPDCGGKDCGDNGCGGDCGECGPDNWCAPDGLCEVATCSIITDCIEACPKNNTACMDECSSAAPVEIQEAFEAFADCIGALGFPYNGPCGDFTEDDEEWQDCWDDWYSQCDEEYYACWPPGDGTCSDLYSCLFSCPTGDDAQACIDECFDNTSLEALDIWDTFIVCLDENGYFNCGEQFTCLDDAWDQCLDHFNNCMCDPECPDVLCESEICDGIDNDCDGTIDELSPDCDCDGTADCIDIEAESGCSIESWVDGCCPNGCAGDSIPDEQDNCPEDINPDQMDSDGDGFGDICDGGCWDEDYQEWDEDCDGCPDSTDCVPFDPMMCASLAEFCDGKDNNCDGEIDEDTDWDCDDGDPDTANICLAGECIVLPPQCVGNPSCGNGIIDPGEECDDGCIDGIPWCCEEGIDDGDGCDWLCQLG